MRQTLFTQFVDRFMGRGAAAVTVPPLDGALKPNNDLEDLFNGIVAKAPDCIVDWQGVPIWSEGARLVSQSGVQAEFGSDITAIAASGCTIAVATLNEGLLLLDDCLTQITPNWSVLVKNVTALTFTAQNELWYCTGSETRAPDNWRRDLLEMNQLGHVGQANPATGNVRVIKCKLGYPSGLAPMPNGSIILSEAWSSHLVEISPDGRTSRVVLDEIPGYPGRISPAQDSGYWLSVFAPRNPLIEFVLREPTYRNAMIREVAPEFWVAPNYFSGRLFNEPMQGGALKQMGILKPWAPTLSYGLVVRLDANCHPVRSFHSRAGGTRHGVTSTIESDGKLWMACRGGNEILSVDLGAVGIPT